MKIALCFYGQHRMFRTCYNNTFQHMINKYKSSGHEIDIFIHTWNDTWDSNNNLKDKNIATPDNILVNEGSTEEVINLYQPKKYQVESYDELKDKEFNPLIKRMSSIPTLKMCYDHTNAHYLNQEYKTKFKMIDPKYNHPNLTYNNVLMGKIGRYHLNGTNLIPFNENNCIKLLVTYISHWYSVYRSVGMKKEYEKENNFQYDKTLLFRFDIQIRNNKMPDITKNGLLTPYDMQYGGFQMVNDHWCFGDNQNVNIYSELYINFENHLKEMAIKNEPLLSYGFPEVMLCYHLLNNKLKLEHNHGIKYGINRNGKT